jgi:hypothetical protein
VDVFNAPPDENLLRLQVEEVCSDLRRMTQGSSGSTDAGNVLLSLLRHKQAENERLFACCAHMTQLFARYAQRIDHALLELDAKRLILPSSHTQHQQLFTAARSGSKNPNSAAELHWRLAASQFFQSVYDYGSSSNSSGVSSSEQKQRSSSLQLQLLSIELVGSHNADVAAAAANKLAFYNSTVADAAAAAAATARQSKTQETAAPAPAPAAVIWVFHACPSEKRARALCADTASVFVHNKNNNSSSSSSSNSSNNKQAYYANGILCCERAPFALDMLERVTKQRNSSSGADRFIVLCQLARSSEAARVASSTAAFCIEDASRLLPCFLLRVKQKKLTQKRR